MGLWIGIEDAKGGSLDACGSLSYILDSRGKKSERR